ncbi:MAG TPA: DUF433 domain-containing protein [Pirellulales bacterium]|nr:DUF433 domain-containing protein [Pirellulales bacterium]
MSDKLVPNPGSGPEITGTRITVYHLLPYFLDGTVTEEYLSKLYGLTIEQIAAARAYILNNVDSVLATHLRIEERIAVGNPPEVVEQAKQTRERLMRFKEWREQKAEDERQEAAADAAAEQPAATQLPSFREWILQHPPHFSGPT